MNALCSPGRPILLSMAAACLLTSRAPAQDAATDSSLQQQVEELLRRDAERQRELEELRRRDAQREQRLEEMAAELERLRNAPGTDPGVADPAEEPRPGLSFDEALDAALAEVESSPPEPTAALASVPLSGGARFQLLDISLDVLTSVGASTEGGSTLESLQGHTHDPRRRGFNLQAAELSATGAVDPYFTADVHLLFGIAPDDGQSLTELEEAFATTTCLPYGLEVEAGQMLTEFGRFNPRHPHQWEWLDAPVIQTRIFGPDGTRAPGARLGWLTPLPWYSAVDFSVQNADTSQMASFLGDAGHGHGSASYGNVLSGVGGGGVVQRDLHGLQDLAYTLRWENSWDCGEETSALLGLSTMYGPNNSGADGSTLLYGADFLLRWYPVNQARGWPFLSWQTEVVARRFDADEFFDPMDPTDPTDDVFQAAEVLEDCGAYSQVLWGFSPRWAVGLRGEVALSAGERSTPRDDDPYRADRFRISPLLMFQPTAHSRLRLQYNFDQAKNLDHDRAHTLWLGLEVAFGGHPAHEY